VSAHRPPQRHLIQHVDRTLDTAGRKSNNSEIPSRDKSWEVLGVVMSEQRPRYSEGVRQFASLHGSALVAGEPEALPVLLTVDDMAQLLRTTNRAIYAMIERRQLPGVIRIGRRVLFRTSDLLDWLNQKSAPSQRSEQR
jgi:excisionase family DNA binding protein